MPEVLEFRRPASGVAAGGVSATGARGDIRLAVGVVVAGLVAYLGSDAIAPPAHDPSRAWVHIALVGETLFLGLAFTGSLLVLNGRARLGYGALASSAWVLVALVVGCPVSGHHRFGAWWAGQMALALGFAAVSTVACALTRHAPPPAGRRAGD